MKKSAFTLVELSIVLVIIGLLVGGSFKVLKMMRERAEITRAQDDVKAAKAAVIGYAQMSNKLPTSADFNSSLSPIKNNQHQLFYVPDSDMQNEDICSFMDGQLGIKVMKLKSDGSGEELDRYIPNVVFVIASEGANHNLQTARGADNNVTIHAPYYKVDDDSPTPINRKEEYDDIVDWVTLSQLQNELECIRKPLAFLNTALPIADVNQSYSATLYVENNVSDVNISCTPSAEKGISFSDPTFSGTPNEAGTSLRTCIAVENGTDRNVTKSYVITINPEVGSSGSDSSGATGSSCTSNSDCNSGHCSSLGICVNF